MPIVARDCTMPYIGAALSRLCASGRMATKSWKLVDQPRGLQVEPQLQIADRDLPGMGEARVFKRTWSGGLSDGVVGIDIDNGAMTLQVLPTRGMGIHAVYMNRDRELPRIGWKSPIRGPVHPAFVDLGEPSGLGWLDGFD